MAQTLCNDCRRSVAKSVRRYSNGKSEKNVFCTSKQINLFNLNVTSCNSFKQIFKLSESLKSA